jgi:large subunit ribosomal protein L10Ae
MTRKSACDGSTRPRQLLTLQWCRRNSRKLVKRLAKKYGAFLASEEYSISTLTPEVLILADVLTGTQPASPHAVSSAERLGNKLTEVRLTTKFQLKTVLCLGVVVGHVHMSGEQVLTNVILSMSPPLSASAKLD